jgi:hypothetical protein
MYLSYQLVLIFIACILIEYKYSNPIFIMFTIITLLLLNEMYNQTRIKYIS